MNLYEQENALWQEWLNHLTPEQQALVCYDGLCPCRAKDMLTTDDDVRDANPRVVFVSKDMNNNPGEDIRDWPMYDVPEEDYYLDAFYVYMLKLLWALNAVSHECLPSFSHQRENYIEWARKYPLINVNLKKESGGASVSMADVNTFVERDIDFLRRQIKGLYAPHVIVCCGGDRYGRVKDAVIDKIYAESSFVQYNDWCYYSANDNVLVIDAYHPKARVADIEKFDKLIANVQDFLHQIQKDSLSA